MRASRVFAWSFLAGYLLLGVFNALSVSSYYAFSAGAMGKVLEYLLIVLFNNMGYKLLAAGLFSILAAFGAHIAACMRGAPRAKPVKISRAASEDEGRSLAG